MNGNRIKKNLLYLMIFVLACELISESSISCLNNKITYKMKIFNKNLIESEASFKKNEKVLKINLIEKETKNKNSLLQIENKIFSSMNFDVSFGIKQYLHFHQSVIF